MYRLFDSFISGPSAIAILGLRLVTGVAFMLHGWSKVQSPFSWMGADSWAPPALQALAAVAEFGGGLGLILGLLTPFAAAGIACTMAVAVFAVHLPAGHAFVAKGPSFELPLIYLMVALSILRLGPGTLSLDYLSFGESKIGPKARPVKAPSLAGLRN